MDGKRIVFNRPYDDPYRVLAAHLVSLYTPRTLQRILSNSSFVKAVIVKEAKQLDIGGIFLDCIDQEIIDNDKLRQKNARLKMLGEFYYSQLDLPRLRSEIRKFADELGVKLD